MITKAGYNCTDDVYEWVRAFRRHVNNCLYHNTVLDSLFYRSTEFRNPAVLYQIAGI